MAMKMMMSDDIDMESQDATATTCAKFPKRHPVKLVPAETDDGKEEYNLLGNNEERKSRFIETTGCTDKDAYLRLITQVNDAQPKYKATSVMNVMNMNSALALMNGIAPENPLEGLLAAQITAAHNMAMEFSRRAMVEGQTEDGIERNLNRAKKMMGAFTAQVETLHKLRNKGQQKIIVQHVQVSEGGQAIIGDINQGANQRE